MESETLSRYLNQLNQKVEHLASAFATAFDDLLIYGSRKALEWDTESKFLYPLTLSLIAALIFWFVFNLMPFAWRWRKYRPIVEYDIWQVERRITLVLSNFLLMTPHRPTVFQEKFRTGKISKEQIRIIIQNKCLSEAWLYDSEAPADLIPIGHNIRKEASEAEKLIDKTLVLQNYAHSKEILLLEKARQCLKKLQIEESLIDDPFVRIGSKKLAQEVSNIDSFHEVTFELYNLQEELKTTLFNFKTLITHQQFRVTKILELFSKEKYKDLISFRNSIERKYRENLFISHYILAASRAGKKRLSKKILEKELRTNKIKKIILDRRLLELYNECGYCKKLIGEIFQNEEIDQKIYSLETDSNIERQFLLNNLNIYNYFRSKDKRMPELGMEMLEPLLVQ